MYSTIIQYTYNFPTALCPKATVEGVISLPESSHSTIENAYNIITANQRQNNIFLNSYMLIILERYIHSLGS